VEPENALIDFKTDTCYGDFLFKHIIKVLEKPHKLSHQHLSIAFFEAECKLEKVPNDFVWVDFEELSNYPMPIVLVNFVKDYFN